MSKNSNNQIEVNPHSALFLAKMHRAITKTLDQADSSDSGILEVLETICRNLRWSLGNFWQLDQNGNLNCVSSWTNQSNFTEFLETSRKSQFKVGEGLPGTVLAQGSAVWVSDLKNFHSFPRIESAKKKGLKSAMAFPIQSRDAFSGVMEFFSDNIEATDEVLLEMMGSIGDQIGQFISRLQMNLELIKKQEQIVDFIENGSLPLHWVGPDGIIIWANSAELKSLGYTKEEYIGKPISQFHADHDTIDDILQRLTRNETLENYEAKLIRKDGSIRNVLINSSVYRVGGEFIHTRCFTRDVTEIKAAQTQLEQAIQLRDEFLSIASHELKTPVTTIKFQMQMLERSARKGSKELLSDPAVITKIETASKQISRLTQLIEDLLDVSKIRSQNLQCDFEETDLANLVNDICVRFQDEAMASGVEIKVITPEKVIGNWDRARLEQVITNLLTNAVKYGNKKPVEVELHSRNNMAELVVKDHGIGISEENLPKIFDRFQRAVSSKHFGGLGLGLYIADQIIRAHRGKIEVESKLGEGTLFKVEIPNECS